jgi:hypothetical protein
VIPARGSATATDANPSPRGARGRWLALDLGVVFFLAHLAFATASAEKALKDPGTGWHLATGRWILATGDVPRADVFSFTAEGRPWIDYYWLFEAVFAGVVRAAGLPVYAAACAVVFALVPLMLYRRTLRAGASPIAALLTTSVAYVVLSAHATARPLVVGYPFVLLVLDRIDAVRGGAPPLRTLWCVPLLVALWCNLHGSFAAAVALVGVTASAAALRWAVVRTRDAWREAAAFAALAVAVVAATLVNPYGIALPLDVVHHLGMASTKQFVEFLSPSFATGGAAVRAFEALALGLIAVTALGATRLGVVDVALALTTLHWALVAQRNMTLFALVAAPLVARGLTALLERGAPGFAARWHAIGAAQLRLRSAFVHVPVAAAVYLALAGQGTLGFAESLEGHQLTPGAAAHVAANLPRFARPFNTETLGGALIERFWPDVRVFVDDRTFVYGDDFVLRDYFPVLYGHDDWAAVLDRWQLDAAIVAVGTPIATLLRASPAWTVEYSDATNLIATRARETGAR